MNTAIPTCLPPTIDRSIEPTNSPDEISAFPGTSPSQNIPPLAAGGFAAQSILQPNNNPSTAAEVDPTISKTRSLAHHLFVANKVVFVSFDIETGGEYCGILQMSAEIVRLEVTPKLLEKGKNKGKPSNSKDYPVNVRRESTTFNKYVKPHEGAIWDIRASAIHGLSRSTDEKIVQADEMDIVWDQFVQWFVSNLERDEVAVLVAYNGETCDLKWLWKLTQAPRSQYMLPPGNEVVLP